MMRSRSIIMALVVTLLAPLPLLAQGGGQGRGGMGGFMGARALLEQGSVEFLAGRVADLELNEEQVTGLKAIGAKWAEETKEPRAKLQAELPQGGQGMGGGDREAMMQRMQALAPLMQKLQEEDEKAIAEAMKLLDETQQAKAKQLIEARRQPRRPGS